MAEAFRSQLLQDENRVQPCSDQPCMICLTPCETLCPETGTIEWEVRLPCKHTVGSGCISKWLEPIGAANDCPMCRYVFFPQQPRPHLADWIFDGEDLTPAAVLASMYDSEPIDTGPAFSRFSSYSESDVNSDSEHLVDEGEEHWRSLTFETIENLCGTYCRRLDLASSPRVTRVTEYLAWKIYGARLFEPCPPTILAAFSVLVGSHLMDVPRTLSQVAMMTEAYEDEIFRLHRLFQHSPRRDEVFDAEILEMIGRGDHQPVLGYLTKSRDLFSDEEILEMVDMCDVDDIRSQLPEDRDLLLAEILAMIERGEIELGTEPPW